MLQQKKEDTVREVLNANFLQLEKEAKGLVAERAGLPPASQRVQNLVDQVIDEVMRLACALEEGPIGVDQLRRLLPAAASTIINPKPRGRPKKAVGILDRLRESIRFVKPQTDPEGEGE